MKILPGYTRPALHALLNERNCKSGAEIGVYEGVHAAQILTAWPGKLYLIDAWTHYAHGVYVDMVNVAQEEQEVLRSHALQNLAPFGPRAEILRMFSHEAAPRFPDGSLDFVYIDANHFYEWVKKDLELWYPKVKPGGIVSGHDYTQDNPDPKKGCFGVKAAVNEFIEGKSDVLYVSNEDWPTWLFFKP